MHDSEEEEHSAEAELSFHAALASPKATKKLRDRVREVTSSKQSGKDVKRAIAELNPVLRGWGN